jgi:hypothetical protein
MLLVKVVEQLHMHIYQDIDLVSSGLPGPPALTHLDPPCTAVISSRRQ